MSSATKTLIIVTLLFLALVAGLVLAFFHMRSVSNQAVMVEEEAARTEAKQDDFQSIRETLENNRKDIEKIDSYLVPANGVPSFLSRVESLGTTTGAVVTTQSVSTEEAPSHQQTDENITEALNLTVIIEGGWNEVFHTVSLIETLPRALYVHAINLSRADTEAEEQQWKATLKLEVLKRTQS